ncbi:hypothetical protein Ddye_004909 [Dipteronia dyeriana]|uniref:DUF4283 domain-containing protein n=1 Tax=Dipteronia dyeriana TaxID=168575 RepID=A0AAE0CP74_9ROSI|nr:hypothetical protein Ddye_004909 [Dipteronia dyeriana]
MDGVDIEVVCCNTVTFTFKNVEDQGCVIHRGPWSFALLVLEKPVGMDNVKEMRFDRVVFWVQIYNVPLLCMTKDIARFLGTKKGEVVEVDEGKHGQGKGKNKVRERVLVDLRWKGGNLYDHLSLIKEIKRRQWLVVVRKKEGGRQVGPQIDHPTLSGQTRVGNTKQEKLVGPKGGLARKLVVESVGCSGGLCLLWSDAVDIGLLSFLKFHIDVTVVMRGCSSWRLASFYGHLEISRRMINLGSWKEIREVEKELNLLLAGKEIYWRQKPHELWLKYGDKNSKSFHWKASNRRSRNTISGLYDSNNVWRDRKMEVEDIVSNYFDDIFKSGNPSRSTMDEVFSCVKPCLSAQKIYFLDANFTTVEIKRVIFDMSPTKILSASGHLINFNKSAMCVSSRVSRQQAKHMAGILRVRLVDCHDRYLGLPSFARRSKCQLFSDIHDQVWDRVKRFPEGLVGVLHRLSVPLMMIGEGFTGALSVSYAEVMTWGSYTFRSGYYVGCLMNSNPSSSGLGLSESWCKAAFEGATESEAFYMESLS